MPPSSSSRRRRSSRPSSAIRSTSSSATATSANFRCGSGESLGKGSAGMFPAPVPAERYSDDQIDAAIEAISDPDVFRESERQVARAAPKLQHILGEALNAGGWFGESQES